MSAGCNVFLHPSPSYTNVSSTDSGQWSPALHRQSSHEPQQRGLKVFDSKIDVNSVDHCIKIVAAKLVQNPEDSLKGLSNPGWRRDLGHTMGWWEYARSEKYEVGEIAWKVWVGLCYFCIVKSQFCAAPHGMCKCVWATDAQESVVYLNWTLSTFLVTAPIVLLVTTEITVYVRLIGIICHLQSELISQSLYFLDFRCSEASLEHNGKLNLGSNLVLDFWATFGN